MLLDSVGNRDGRSRGWEEGTEFDTKTKISIPESATVRLAEINSKNSTKRMTTETACENDDSKINTTCYK